MLVELFSCVSSDFNELIVCCLRVKEGWFGSSLVAVSVPEKPWQVVTPAVWCSCCHCASEEWDVASKYVLLAWLGWVQRAGAKPLIDTGAKGSFVFRLRGLLCVLGTLWMRAGACQATSQCCWSAGSTCAVNRQSSSGKLCDGMGGGKRNLCVAPVVSHKKRGLSTPLSASCFRSITLSFPSAEVWRDREQVATKSAWGESIFPCIGLLSGRSADSLFLCLGQQPLLDKLLHPRSFCLLAHLLLQKALCRHCLVMYIYYLLFSQQAILKRNMEMVRIDLISILALVMRKIDYCVPINLKASISSCWDRLELLATT